MKQYTIELRLPFPPSFVGPILRACFESLVLSYLSLVIIELSQPGFVTHFLTLTTPLYITVIFGVLTSIWKAPAEKERSIILHHLSPILVALLGGALVWTKTAQLGNGAIVITVLTTMILYIINTRVDITEHPIEPTVRSVRKRVKESSRNS